MITIEDVKSAKTRISPYVIETEGWSSQMSDYVEA